MVLVSVLTTSSNLTLTGYDSPARLSWGNQSEPSTSTSDWVSVEPDPPPAIPLKLSQSNTETSYQLDFYPARTEPISEGHFRSYRTLHAWENEHGNEEAISPTLVPSPPALSVRSPTPQPPGRAPETTADAGNTQATEGGESPVSSFYRPHIPRVAEWSFGVRFPSGPGSYTARENFARPAYGNREMSRGSANGYRCGTTSLHLRPFTMHRPVSICLIDSSNTPDLI